MQNLRDQLLKAGLISEGQSQPARPREQAKPKPPAANAPRPEREARPARQAPIPRLPPLPVPNNKEIQRLDARKQVELDRQMRELVTSSQLAVEPGEHTFFFVTRKNR